MVIKAIGTGLGLSWGLSLGKQGGARRAGTQTSGEEILAGALGSAVGGSAPIELNLEP